MKIDHRRIYPLQEGESRPDAPVLYVVARDQRVHDNWALHYALSLANERRVPLLVLFALGPMFQNGSARHNEWMVASLAELAANLAKKDIPFFIEMGTWSDVVRDFVAVHSVGEVVLDFNPLEPVRTWREELKNKLTIPVNVVDAHNIIPCAVVSPKAEFAAYTIRPKIHRLLPEFLVPVPALPAVTVPYTKKVPAIDWEQVRAFRKCDYSEAVPTIYVPGEAAALSQLTDFIEHRLASYAIDRNDPTKDGVSGLSPYIRWGNISTTRIALAVQAADVPGDAKAAFLEELIVRRELAENYCFYTKDYATVEAAHAWAQTTIKEHAKDAREYLYTYEEFRDGLTHDDLWNAAQRQMVIEGKMHGFLRMYWAKKILEWTPDAQTAIDIALRLNDHYELDGRDSNGVVGVMWSICGVHDRAWNTRPIFGKVRYMNYAGCKRKFDVKAFVQKYNSSSETPLFI
ncbi:MAG: deoxyribodipyrimidine photo-lyase [Candidatus Pacebacteria bacterium]|jgi:deoxyribodipyrimidine photo-lyase|nr:deoxyribodipyrimidine photo-lyase [Candidatus Paceibacterota bacterium]